MSRELFDPYESEEVAPAHMPHWAAKRRVADAIRELTEVLNTSAPPGQELHEIAERLEATTARFKEMERIYGRLAFCEAEKYGHYGEIFHEMSPLSGQGNPLAPPLRMWLDNGEAFGTANLGWAYEGPPAHVHGGYVAALFDDFMGMAQRLANNAGMTGTLTIRYRKPTPLNTLLRLHAWVGSSEGRKTVMHATIHAGDTLTAECEALFIRPREGIGIKGA